MPARASQPKAWHVASASCTDSGNRSVHRSMSLCKCADPFSARVGEFPVRISLSLLLCISAACAVAPTGSLPTARSASVAARHLIPLDPDPGYIPAASRMSSSTTGRILRAFTDARTIRCASCSATSRSISAIITPAPSSPSCALNLCSASMRNPAQYSPGPAHGSDPFHPGDADITSAPASLGSRVALCRTTTCSAAVSAFLDVVHPGLHITSAYAAAPPRLLMHAAADADVSWYFCARRARASASFGVLSSCHSAGAAKSVTRVRGATTSAASSSLLSLSFGYGYLTATAT
mmetsp:Transcript_4784/g.21653  ORF Transcript_4784/g.21653 Transcript_4784/m.21653 type:complete len:293 (-) Transcript_4784:464-1342(-)